MKSEIISPRESRPSDAELAEAEANLASLWSEYSASLTACLKAKLDRKNMPPAFAGRPIRIDPATANGSLRRALEKLEQASRSCFQFSNACLEAGGALADLVHKKVAGEIEAAGEALGRAEDRFKELSGRINGSEAVNDEAEREIRPALFDADVCFQKLQALEKIPRHIKNGRLPPPQNILDLLPL